MDLDELFKNYSNDEEKIIDIVSTLSNDEDKFKAIQYLSSDRNKMLVIHQIFSESLLVQSMDLVEDEEKKLIIAFKLLDNSNKLTAIKKLASEKDKVTIAKMLSNDHQIIDSSSLDDLKEFYVLPDLHHMIYRIDLINSFSHKERRDTLMQQELSDFQKKANDILKKGQEFASQNILNLPPQLTIGVELEANGIAPDDVNVLFYNLRNINYSISKWIAKSEITIPHGSEVISPILNFSHKCIQDLYFVAEIMKFLDFKPGENCGGHIHFGLRYFEIDENGNYNIELINKSLKNLLTIWGESEELFFKMSNPENNITRTNALKNSGSGKGFASSIGQIIQDFIDDGDLDFEAVCDEIEKTRYRSVNLLNFYPEGINTIEFRLSNSTIEPIEILQNIYLYGRLMVVSKDITLHPEKYTVKLRNFKNTNVSEAEKVEALLDLLFETESQKSIYRKRWRSIRDAEIYNSFELRSPTFRRGDYSLKGEITSIIDDVSLGEMDNFEEAVSLSSNSKSKDKIE